MISFPFFHLPERKYCWIISALFHPSFSFVFRVQSHLIALRLIYNYPIIMKPSRVRPSIQIIWVSHTRWCENKYFHWIFLCVIKKSLKIQHLFISIYNEIEGKLFIFLGKRKVREEMPWIHSQVISCQETKPSSGKTISLFIHDSQHYEQQIISTNFFQRSFSGRARLSIYIIPKFLKASIFNLVFIFHVSIVTTILNFKKCFEL